MVLRTLPKTQRGGITYFQQLHTDTMGGRKRGLFLSGPPRRRTQMPQRAVPAHRMLAGSAQVSFFHFRPPGRALQQAPIETHEDASLPFRVLLADRGLCNTQ